MRRFFYKILCCPEIAIHKFHRYAKHSRKSLCKAHPKDYSMSLKLQIVQEIETAKLSISLATKKYGIQYRKTVVQ